jgi:hypothetical protein
MTKQSKAEARIARQAKRAADNANKNVRFASAVKEELAARFVENPASTYQMTVSWNVDNADVLEAWSWGVMRQWSDDDWNETILPKLEQFKVLTWAEIDKLSSDTGHKMHHSTATSLICDEAQLRLWDIEKHEDNMFRFRLGNLPRLWGFKRGAEFQVLWYDPTHQIYPTQQN